MPSRRRFGRRWMGGLALSLALAGCARGLEAPTAECGAWTAEATVDADLLGDAQLQLGLPDTIRAVQIRATADDGYATSIAALEGPDGLHAWDMRDLAGTALKLTDAGTITSRGSVLNWPVRASDAALVGGVWTLHLQVANKLGFGASGTPIHVSITGQNCTPTAPTVPVSLVFTGGAEEKARRYATIEAALDDWAEIFADVGLSLDITESDSDLDPELERPDDTGDYSALYRDTGATGILMVLGDSILSDDAVDGVTGSVPGPIGPLPGAAAVVDWGAADLGRVMAHEAGHYLGLMHPVECPWDSYDALDDTPTCTDAVECDELLGQNLMFPGVSGVGRLEITDEQEGVLQGWVGLR